VTPPHPGGVEDDANGATSRSSGEENLVLNLVSRDWRVLAVRGVVVILFGIMAIAWPGIALIVSGVWSLGLVGRLHGVASAHPVPAAAS
jgi:uncharacterized membrane protein HdeD (DUF308 family)